jgi:hypothetical protein
LLLENKKNMELSNVDFERTAAHEDIDEGDFGRTT